MLLRKATIDDESSSSLQNECQSSPLPVSSMTKTDVSTSLLVVEENDDIETEKEDCSGKRRRRKEYCGIGKIGGGRQGQEETHGDCDNEEDNNDAYYTTWQERFVDIEKASQTQTLGEAISQSFSYLILPEFATFDECQILRDSVREYEQCDKDATVCNGIPIHYSKSNGTVYD